VDWIRDVSGSVLACAGFRPHEETKMAEPMKGRSVGVIGGGPAGMLAAAYMAKSGAMVTVFERVSPVVACPRCPTAS